MRLALAWLGLSALGALGLFVACGVTDTEVGGTVSEGLECGTPGKAARHTDGCNTCTCLDSGTWACTKIGCDAECDPDEVILGKDGCNTCSCAEDGTWACTLMACLDCEAGQKKLADDGCNTCVCGEDGTWACTEMACEKTCVDEAGKVYYEGQSFLDSDGCNTCGCMDGMIACTAMACLCKPGDVIPAGDGCNTCSCGEDGQMMCLRMACATCPEPAPLPKDTACTEQIVWAKDPSSGTCCQYGTPCNAPADWQTFPSEEECMGIAACPVPAKPPEGIACNDVIVYARDPESGACCMYGDPCSAPSGWETYYTEEECLKAATQ